MRQSLRLSCLATLTLALGVIAFAQEAAPPPAAPAAQAPAPATPPPAPGAGTTLTATPPAAAVGRGRGANAGPREIMGLGTVPPAEVIAAGKAVFEANCSFCHGPDARGAQGPDLLQSQVVLDDEGTGKQIGATISKGFPPLMPAFSLSDQQVSELAAFLHDGVLQIANLAHGQYVLPFKVDGDAAAGEAFFNGAGKCSTCHSVTGDLAGIGSKYQPLDIQNAILTGRAGGGYAGFGRGAGRARPQITVTLASGQTITGAEVFVNDFNVGLTDANGAYHSIALGPGVKVQLPQTAAEKHQALLGEFTDADIHNLTAYLVSLK